MMGSEAGRLATAPALDFAAIGFRCGLEIHQQLATRKLFSRLPSEVVEPDEVPKRTVAQVERRLRATASELGEVDAAAESEARRGLRFRYLAIDGLTSLVELDEEPPLPMSEAALDVALTFSGLVGARPVDEVHVMRKTVIDGSNTSGFQRTALVATGGKVDAPGGDVGVWTIALEEDSARKVEEKDDVVTYTLDRLGIPLIEVATAPEIREPAHAQKVAARIGALLRATGRVKRGLGTIRQDLNVSVAVGARVEVKGCQDLRAIPRIIEAECRRQLWMHHIGEELRKRGGPRAENPTDVTACFAASQAKSVREGRQTGGSVYGVRLPHGAGLLKGAAKDGPRLGRELADHARVYAAVKGIFHSDELPAYGITEAEVAAVRAALSCGADDAFALCVAPAAVASSAVAAASARFAMASGAPLKEVRGVQPDDSTRFMRPMPGAARMYPETDVPPIRITPGSWQVVRARLPPKPEEKIQTFAKQGLGLELAGQIVAEGWENEYQALVAEGAEPAMAARVLLQFVPQLKHAEAVIARLPALFDALRAGKFAKEAIPQLLQAIDADVHAPLDAVLGKAGVGAADAAAVDAVVAKVIADRLDYVKSRGMAAVGPLMGPVMAELRGKADGALVAERLKAGIAAATT
jgi:glutamyl-tRNA(Gln) amidotransferase subunit E